MSIIKWQHGDEVYYVNSLDFENLCHVNVSALKRHPALPSHGCSKNIIFGWTRFSKANSTVCVRLNVQRKLRYLTTLPMQ